MQAVEALQRLIETADQRAADYRNLEPHLDSEEEQQQMKALHEDLSLAAAVGQAMLNTALPVARFRAFIEVDDEQPKRSAFQQSVAVTREFTICATTMAELKSGLVGITHVPTNVKISVFEQRANGADMISGYQGLTKGKKNWTLFLEGLTALEALPTVQ